MPNEGDHNGGRLRGNWGETSDLLVAPACKRLERYYMREGQGNQGETKRKPGELGEAIKGGESGGIGTRGREEGEGDISKSSTPTARCVSSQRPPTFQDS